MNLLYDFSWLLLYIAGFGISDLIVTNYIKNVNYKWIYFSILFFASIGTIIYCVLHERKKLKYNYNSI